MIPTAVWFFIFLIPVESDDMLVVRDLSIRFADDSLLPINEEFLTDDANETCTGFQNTDVRANYHFTQFRINSSDFCAKNLTVSIIGRNLGCGRNLYVSPLSLPESEKWTGRWSICNLTRWAKNDSTDRCSYLCTSDNLKDIQVMRVPHSNEDLYWEVCHIKIERTPAVAFGCSDMTYTCSGVYEIKIPNSDKLANVYCDQQTEGGGWTVILRRVDGSENFNREWDDYKNGFSNLTGEFWAGNEMMHKLTMDGQTYFLRVELESYEGEFVFAEYSNFSIGPESDNYRLHVTGYQPNSTAGDSLSYHDGMMFSTPSRDNDLYPLDCCAKYFRSWWHNQCSRVLLTGKYGQNVVNGKGIIWRKAWPYEKCARSARMMIRPA